MTKLTTMEEIYYDPQNPSSFGGVARLAKAANSSVAATKQWMESQPTYTIHKPARKRGYPTRSYRTKGVDYQWQADLVEMIPWASENSG